MTVSASAVSPADSRDFALSVNRKLTIATGETESTGTVVVTAVDNAVDDPDRQVTVNATIVGPAGLEAPAARTLTITDDEGAPTVTPTVTLVLAPEEVSENGGESRVTAQLSGATSEDVTLTVSASAVSPADSRDFALSVNRELTIAAGETESTGTVVVTAVDNAVDDPDRQVTVNATIVGPAGLEAPDPRTLTIDDDDERNRPPAFSQESYEFGLEEERDGRTTEVSLGSGGLTATALVAVEVLPVNEPPEAEDDAAETQEDEPVVVDVLANDRDPDGDRLRVVDVTPRRTGQRRWRRAACDTPRHGTITVRIRSATRWPTPRD